MNRRIATLVRTLGMASPRTIRLTALALLALAACAYAQIDAFPPGPVKDGVRQNSAAATNNGNAKSLMRPEQDLAMKMRGSFTFVGVGDLIMRNPMGQLRDPSFQSLIQHLRDADVAFANLEGPLLDLDTFPDPIGDAAPKGSLADMKSMGIDIVTTANDHSTQADVAGVFETIRLLDEAGIAYAGTGRNLQEARAPHFLNTPKGTVGLVAAWATDVDRHQATYRNGDSGGRPGMNALGLTREVTVTEAQMEQLRAIRDSVYARRNEVFAPVAPIPANEAKDRLELYGVHYRVGPKPGEVSYVMDADDLKETMRSIRNGKEYSDFMIATVHCHQGNYAFQTYTYDNDTPDFLIQFAHQAIDNGADVFVGHGVHTIRGVEIYKGKPIFYGVNNLIYQYHFSRPQNPGGSLTDAELSMLPNGYAGEKLAQPERMESLIAESRFENGQLVEVRLYPVDLGQDLNRPFSRIGIPMTPSPEMAQRVLEKVRRLSKPFGTNIEIENGIGLIRLSRVAVSGSTRSGTASK